MIFSNELKLQNVSFGYSKEKILYRDLSLTFKQGITAVIGLNGSGKSTLIKSIATLLPLLNGNVLLNGKNVQDLSETERAKLISIVLTHRVTLPYFSVFDFISIGRSPYTSRSGNLKSEDLQYVEKAMKLCGIDHLRHKMLDEISDGERQKCSLACAIAQQTPVILLDEPTTFLDFRSRYEWMQLLRLLATEDGKIILFTSHDLEAVFHFSDQCLVLLQDGRYDLVTKSQFTSSEIIHDLLKGSALKFEEGNLRFSYPNSFNGKR
jgi:iron complex transport system ATP-binding protein